MARRTKAGPGTAPPRPPEFKVNPFADLRVKLPGTVPEPRIQTPPKVSAPPPGATLDAEDRRLLEAFKDAAAIEFRDHVPTVRIETHSRRGGLTVTAVRGLRGMDMLEQMQMTDDVRVRLGLRARFRGDVLEVDGDQRQRLASWLQSRGYAMEGSDEPG